MNKKSIIFRHHWYKIGLIFCLMLIVTSLMIGFFFSWRDKASKHNLKNTLLRMTDEFILWGMGSTLAAWDTYADHIGQGNHLARFIPSLTNEIDLWDMRTFLGQGLPSLGTSISEIDVASGDIDYTFIPIERPPSQEIEQAIIDELSRQKPQTIIQDPKSHEDLPKKVLIYHTHFWESYLPEIGQDLPDNASDLNINITQVGRYLNHALQKLHIGSLMVKNTYVYKQAYSSSKKMVREAWERYGNVPYLIDVHRDSQRRSKTTITCNNQSYARFAFVVGRASSYFEHNLRFARFLHQRINNVCPGLSKAVFIKSRDDKTNGEYNQSLSPHSILVEVGGVDNLYEETYRSIDILANSLKEYILQQD